MSVLQRTDFYNQESVLHPLGVGIPLTFLVWLYLRLAPNRLLTSLTKFDYIASITLGSTLSRIITGSGTTLDFTRGLLSLLLVIGFQSGMSHLTARVAFTRKWFRTQPRVIVFRGQFMEREMRRDAVLMDDVKIGMRRCGVLQVSQIEALVLEASGGFTCVTKKQIEDAGLGGQVPECLDGVAQYVELCNAAAAAASSCPASASGGNDGGPGIQQMQQQERKYSSQV